MTPRSSLQTPWSIVYICHGNSPTSSIIHDHILMTSRGPSDSHPLLVVGMVQASHLLLSLDTEAPSPRLKYGPKLSYATGNTPAISTPRSRRPQDTTPASKQMLHDRRPLSQALPSITRRISIALIYSADESHLSVRLLIEERENEAPSPICI
ncbi:hypothetical protein PAXRUDRAFT_424742 [Paxillus rubicundulus Ve08.2h10]|uniref:Uncharacterized protein n=1 Tax=Paxillus rubicundulus Ve08.2h10 TaxID=930991 RepID=A0A0D0DC83_9AGAM|nr:hypothetical protein PAXRUDRAFT_424742 [Paxillus rubicundulus Ve08.2h10]